MGKIAVATVCALDYLVDSIGHENEDKKNSTKFAKFKYFTTNLNNRKRLYWEREIMQRTSTFYYWLQSDLSTYTIINFKFKHMII